MSTRTDADAGADEYPQHGAGALPPADVGRLLLRCADRSGLIAAGRDLAGRWWPHSCGGPPTWGSTP